MSQDPRSSECPQLPGNAGVPYEILDMLPSKRPVTDPALLRQTSYAINADAPGCDAWLAGLVEAMSQVMLAHRGVGLAAVQVGVLARVIIARSSVLKGPDGIHAYVNPRIIRRKGSQESGEGCLSRPGWHGVVRRAKTVWWNHAVPGKGVQAAVADGFMAAVIQHEIDHLDGVLCWEKAGRNSLPAR